MGKAEPMTQSHASSGSVVPLERLLALSQSRRFCKTMFYWITLFLEFYSIVESILYMSLLSTGSYYFSGESRLWVLPIRTGRHVSKVQAVPVEWNRSALRVWHCAK